MKKLISGIVLMLVMVTSVLAAIDVTVTPVVVTLPDDGSQVTVDVQVDYASSYPQPLKIDSWCKEVSGNPDYCDASDIMGTSEINVSVDALTDGSGAANAYLNWNGPGMGKYHYTICVTDGSACIYGLGAEVTADALIPEFTTIGAGLVLLGAGLYMYRKRRQ